MNFNDNSNDFFDGVNEPEQKAPEQKRPKYNPEDPEYWDQPESEFDHLHIRPRRMPWGWIILAGVAVGLILTLTLYWFRPYVQEAHQVGYVENIDKQGMVFDTFEGVLLPYKELMDTTRVYRQDFIFSTSDPKLAARIVKMQFAGRPVRITYRRYHGRLPWRGASDNIVTEVDSVDPATILPPEFAPNIMN